MKHWFFQILSGLSLLLCLTSIALWARSHWAEDELSCEHASEQNAIRTFRTWRCSTCPGGILLNFSTSESHYTVSIPPGFQMPTFHWTSTAGDKLKKQQEDQWRQIEEARKRLSLPPLSHTPVVLTARSRYYWGFNYDSNRPDLTHAYYTLDIPYWFFVLSTSLLPTLWLLQILRHRRRLRLGLCLTCGYDLRASHDRCPECGSPIPTNPAPPTASTNL